MSTCFNMNNAPEQMCMGHVFLFSANISFDQGVSVSSGMQHRVFFPPYLAVEIIKDARQTQAQAGSREHGRLGVT